MKLKRPALTVLLVLLVCLVARAQPVLPAITGVAENGIVLLSWVCQYDGVKTIAVRQSTDSMFNYKIIGYVKNTRMGVQAFADGHALPGNNYYKLNVVFNSGLNWSSNHFRVYVDSAQMNRKKAVLPGNDSLQKFIVADAVPEKHAQPVAAAGKIAKRDSVESGKETVPPGKVVLSANADTVAVLAKAEPEIIRKKISFVFPEQDDIPFIASEYINVNKLSGHVEMKIPADFKEHDYSVRFYNRQFRMIMEVPLIKALVIIVDKRNFQRKGVYKFVLKRDGVELESGYLTL